MTLLGISKVDGRYVCLYGCDIYPEQRCMYADSLMKGCMLRQPCEGGRFKNSFKKWQIYCIFSRVQYNPRLYAIPVCRFYISTRCNAVVRQEYSLGSLHLLCTTVHSVCCKYHKAKFNWICSNLQKKVGRSIVRGLYCCIWTTTWLNKFDAILGHI